MSQAPSPRPKPLPTPTRLTQPFWDGLKAGRVMIQYSPSLGRWVFFPRHRAPGSLADDLEWREVSGLGQVYTFTVCPKPSHRAWAADTPQVIAVVELDEGVRLTTTIEGIDPAQIRCGLRVKPRFVPAHQGDITLLHFEPA